MEAYYEILSQCPLFAGITRQEMPEILNCLDKKVVEIPKGDPVFLEGEPARFVGVVLSGGVQIVRDDYYGNRSVLTVVAPGAGRLAGERLRRAEQHRAPAGLQPGDDRLRP